MIIKLVLGKLKFVNDVFYENLIHTHRYVTSAWGQNYFTKGLQEGAGALRYMGYIGMCSRIAYGV